MKQDTARNLLDLFLRHGKEQNAILQELSDQESDAELAKIKLMIGHTMGSIYLDAIYPILTEHPELTPPGLHRPAT